ncbi:hypothetical protein D3C71_1956360 [compost metagenome]
MTDVFVTGIDTRCINVRPRPIAIGAKPAGAKGDVAPRIITMKKAVNKTSAISAAISP